MDPSAIGRPAVRVGLGLLCLSATAAHADLANDLGTCIKKSAEAAYNASDTAEKLAGLVSDPHSMICVNQVVLPDPVTLVGAGVVQGLNLAKHVSSGSCQADLQNKALEPLVGGIGTLTGLSLDKDPLEPLVKQGKEALWQFLVSQPPAVFVMGGIDCGCRFVDAGISVDTVKTLYKSFSEAGESCGKVAERAAEAACDAIDSVSKAIAKDTGSSVSSVACAAIKTKTKLIVDPLGAVEDLYNGLVEEGVFALAQDKPESPQQHYQRIWQPMEAPYVARSIEIGQPVPGDGQFPGPNGGYWKLKDTWTVTKNYYDGHKMNPANAQKVADAMRERFMQTVVPQIDLGLDRKAFEPVAKQHREARTQGVDFAKLGGYSVELDTLYKQYVEDAWLSWRANAARDRSKFIPFLDLSFNATVQPELDRLKKTTATQLSAVPSAILAADAMIEDLPQAVAAEVEKPCQGLQQQIHAACLAAATSSRKQAEALRESKR